MSAPQRCSLPARRPSANLKMAGPDGRTVHAGAGYNPATGALVEIWVDCGKSGSDTQHACHDAAALVSIALQHGVPLAALAAAVDRDGAGRPVSIIGAVLLALEAGDE